MLIISSQFWPKKNIKEEKGCSWLQVQLNSVQSLIQYQGFGSGEREREKTSQPACFATLLALEKVWKLFILGSVCEALISTQNFH